MKLWDKGYNIEETIERFTVGKDRELDLFLAPWDVLGTIAHITMLESVDLLEEEELLQLKKELIHIYETTLDGSFEIPAGVEDVHSQVEQMLTERLGEMGKKVHSGRSRNDQVLVDLKLFFLDSIREMVELIQALFDTLLELSDRYKDILIPGYTHLQVAMPSSFGLWFGAYAESLVDDVIMFHAAYKVADQNPLGSAAGYGSSFPLNRKMTTQLLGFSTLSYNVVYAQMGRGKTEKLLAFAVSSIASTLNKLAMDVCLYMNQNFGFLTFPDALTTGSSIMPHKKNPDVFELVRARTNKLQALPGEISHIISNLPSGYHRDLQLVKESLLPAMEEMKSCIEITTYMLQQVIVSKDIIHDPKYAYLFSVEAVNREVLKGIPFREAYRRIGQQIQEGKFEPDTRVSHSHEGSIGNLCLPEIRKKMQAQVKLFSFEHFQHAIQQLLK